MQTSFYTAGFNLDSQDLVHCSTKQGRLKVVENFYHALESDEHVSYLVLWSASEAAKQFENEPCVECTTYAHRDRPDAIEWYVHHKKNEICPLASV